MDTGGRCGGASCDEAGIIVIEGLASDDRTPQDRIGYLFSWAEGRLPAGMTLSGQALDMPIFDGRFQLEWNDGASGDQEALAFALDVVAVDAAGNESPPQRLRVMDPGSGGCRVAAKGASIPDGTLLVILAVIAAGTRRRRRLVGSLRNLAR